MLRDKGSLTFHFKAGTARQIFSVKAKTFEEICKSCELKPENCELLSVTQEIDVTEEYLEEQRGR